MIAKNDEPTSMTDLMAAKNVVYVSAVYIVTSRGIMFFLIKARQIKN
jgi:hypothetical protein